MSLDPLALQLVRAKAQACPAFRAKLRQRLAAMQAKPEPEETQTPVENHVESGSGPRDWLRVTRPPTMASLAEAVCRKHGISLADFKGVSRSREFQAPRREFAWRARHELGKSFPQIGRFMNRDHSTVMHAIRKYQELHAERLEAAE